MNRIEDQVEGYELNEDGAWWCKHNNPDTFFENLVDRSIEDFISKNWDFFHDNSEKGGANMDIRLLNNIVEGEYGNYIRNLWVRKCGHNR